VGICSKIANEKVKDLTAFVSETHLNITKSENSSGSGVFFFSRVAVEHTHTFIMDNQVGGSMIVKKIEKKVKVAGKERCVYVDCKQREYVKMKGKYVRLADARSM
jgi:hypothetical protein